MKKSVKTIAVAVIAILAGYVIGAYFGYPLTTEGNYSGNISKVQKYNKISVSPALNAFQEKIVADSAEMAKAAVSLTALTSRMKEFSSLVIIAEDASAGYPELQEDIENLVKVKSLSDNAVDAGKLAIASFNSVASGIKDPKAAAYEQTSQNLTLAYLMVDRQITLAKDYIASVDRFLYGKNTDDYMGLACARDLWATYCAGSARINGDKEEMEYWAEKGTILDSEIFADAFKAVADSTLLHAVAFDNMLGINENIAHAEALEKQEWFEKAVEVSAQSVIEKNDDIAQNVALSQNEAIAQNEAMAQNEVFCKQVLLSSMNGLGVGEGVISNVVVCLGKQENLGLVLANEKVDELFSNITVDNPALNKQEVDQINQQVSVGRANAVEKNTVAQ